MNPDTPVWWVATGFGLGQLPWLPGTAGAALGLLFALALDRLSFRRRLLAVMSLLVLAWVVCESAWRLTGYDDPRIVADEWLPLPVATVALPVSRHPALLAAAFIVSRVFDAVKPPPAGAVEKLHGGIGMVLDDVFANLWSLLLVFVGWRVWRRR